MTFAPESGGASVLPSPNHNERRPGPVDILLLHYTGMPTGTAALDWLRDPASHVSSHYLVFEDGRVVQLVPEARRAWHAGLSYWAGETDLNSRSIGVEIVNPGHDLGYQDFPGPQIDAVIRLGQEIVRRHPIPGERVLAHSCVAPERKQDPGERFPWKTLAEAGLCLWVEPAPLSSATGPTLGSAGPEVVQLKKDFARVGYHVSAGDAFDAATAFTVAAFQRRYRPARVDAVADSSTLETLARLIRALEERRRGPVPS